MIARSQLEEMFESIRRAGQWDIYGPMLWGYFFTDPSAQKLEKAVPLLEHAGYRFVSLFEPELDEGADTYFFLHVEREEAHTVDSLFDRNSQLEGFAALHGLATYDGMDVGPIKSAH